MELMDLGEKKLRDDAIGENDEINFSGGRV